MKALLITKDDQKFNLFKKSFEKNFIGLKLITTRDENEGIKYVSEDASIAFFVVDATINSEIVTVLNAIMDVSGNRPIVICGNEEDLKSINKGLIFKNEANCVLKDYNDDDKIKKVINSAIEWSKKQNSVATDDEDEQEEAGEQGPVRYISMKLRNLYLYETFPNDLYVKIGENRYVIAIEKDTEIREYEIAKLVKRKIKTLYIERDSHIKFLDSSMKNAQTFFKTAPDLNKKVIMAHLRATALLQDYLTNIGLTVEINKFIEGLLDHIIAVLDKEHSIERFCELYGHKLESVISRSLISAYLSFYLLKEMGWKSTTVRRKFILASLIQDAFIENDALSRLKSLKDPSIIDFTEEEIRLYPEHPKLIADIARQFTQFPDIDFLLEQHHELPTRDGFPNRPPPSEVQIAVCIFNLASNFARDIDSEDMSLSTMQKIYRASYVKDFNVGNFKEPVAKLKRVLKL